MGEVDDRRLDRIRALEEQLRESNNRNYFLTLETTRMAEENIRLQEKLKSESQTNNLLRLLTLQAIRLTKQNQALGQQLQGKDELIAEIQGGAQY